MLFPMMNEYMYHCGAWEYEGGSFVFIFCCYQLILCVSAMSEPYLWLEVMSASAVLNFMGTIPMLLCSGLSHISYIVSYG